MKISLFSNRMAWTVLWAAGLLLRPLPAPAYQMQYSYDDAGRLLQANYGGGQTIDYAYDANGNLLTRSAASGAEFILVYTALSGGTIDGVATQIVALGGSGSAVAALTNAYYEFVQWSDGLGDAARTDTNVQANLAVSAQFAAILAAQGTPHWWLAAHGYSNDFDDAEASDDDDDGFTAGQEYAADTDPGNSNDYFFVSDALSPEAADAIRFHSSTGRLYVLQGCTPADPNVWTNVPGRGPRLGLGGDDGLAPLADSPAQLYRVRVQTP